MPRRILVASDLSDCSRAAIDCGALIAHEWGATVQLLYVSRVPEVLAGDAVLLGDAFVDADVIKGHKELDRIVSELARAGVTCTSKVRTGFADDVLIEEANSGQYDLLVMGTHGRSGFKRLYLGSVAAKVARRARIPVLTVPARSAVWDSSASSPVSQ